MVSSGYRCQPGMPLYLDRPYGKLTERLASQRLYLISSLQSLARHESASPSLCSAHIRLLISPSNAGAASPEKILKLARKYTSNIPQSAEVWLARLGAEK